MFLASSFSQIKVILFSSNKKSRLTDKYRASSQFSIDVLTANLFTTNLSWFKPLALTLALGVTLGLYIALVEEYGFYCLGFEDRKRITTVKLSKKLRLWNKASRIYRSEAYALQSKSYSSVSPFWHVSLPYMRLLQFCTNFSHLPIFMLMHSNAIDTYCGISGVRQVDIYIKKTWKKCAPPLEESAPPDDFGWLRAWVGPCLKYPEKARYAGRTEPDRSKITKKLKLLLKLRKDCTRQFKTNCKS